MKLIAEWIPYMEAYRLYNEQHPEQTISYEENKTIAEQRVLKEGYAGLVIK